ncbi:hypothetical protein P261_01034 [Lachnospiraceae bacterium TWA4]|nr:hypothetical protein P261_01034 [Lachnospiraceae bacterium TWA4]
MTEKEKFQSLDKKEKVTYLWDYYKIPIIGGISIILIAIYLVYISLTRPNEQIFYASLVNSFADVSEDSEFYKEFVDYAGIDTKDYTVNLETGSHFDLSSISGSNNVYYQKTIAIVEAGMVDVIVTDKANYEALASTGRFLSLEDERVKSIYDAYPNRVLSTIHVETGQKAYVGIDVSDSKWWKQLQTYENGAVVLINPDAPHIEKVKSFIDFLCTKES